MGHILYRRDLVSLHLVCSYSRNSFSPSQIRSILHHCPQPTIICNSRMEFIQEEPGGHDWNNGYRANPTKRSRNHCSRCVPRKHNRADSEEDCQYSNHRAPNCPSNPQASQPEKLKSKTCKIKYIHTSSAILTSVAVYPRCFETPEEQHTTMKKEARRLAKTQTFMDYTNRQVREMLARRGLLTEGEGESLRERLALDCVADPFGVAADERKGPSTTASPLEPASK